MWITVLLLYEECLGGSRSRAGACPGTGLSHLSQLARGWLARRQRLARSSRGPASGTGCWQRSRWEWGAVLPWLGSKCLLAAAAALPHMPPLAPPKEMEPVLHQVGYVRCAGMVKAWLPHIIHAAGRNFLLAEFSLSLHLGENLKDIWTYWNHLVLICWSISTWKRSICWKISAFGTSCSLRRCVVGTSDIESQGVRKGCFLDWRPKLRCRRRLGRALG